MPNNTVPATGGIALPAATTVGEVITNLRAVDVALAPDDGLKWFNSLYLEVTLAVQNAASNAEFSDAAWISTLDVVFANLYFGWVQAGAGGGAVPAAWTPLFEMRKQPGIARVQFALAGMNAHINRDLPVALKKCAEVGGFPTHESVRHGDYEAVNTLLSRVEARTKQTLLTGVLKAADGSLGALDDVLAMWSVAAAREAAWNNGEVLSHLQSVSVPLTEGFLRTLDKATGLAGSGLLVRTQL